MVLQLPAKLIPRQSDVRETSGVAASPNIGDFTNSQHTHADATGGGLTTHKSGDGSDHANVALNDTHRASNGTNHANVVTNTTDVATNVTAIGLNTTHRGSTGVNHSHVVTNDTHVAGNGSDHADVATNTAAKHTQNTDTALGSGAVAADHGTASTDQIVNISYGTGAPPAANTTTIGSLYVTYTA